MEEVIEEKVRVMLEVMKYIQEGGTMRNLSVKRLRHRHSTGPG